MIKLLNNKRGVTLVEIIAVLVIVSILAAAAGMGVIAITHGYLFANNNAQMTQKTTFAMKRITRELQEISLVSNGSADSITFSSILGTRTIGFHDNAIKLSVNGAPIANGDILMDEITNLSFNYKNNTGAPWVDTDNIEGLTGIEISFTILRSDTISGDMTFTTIVYLRNNNNPGGSIYL